MNIIYDMSYVNTDYSIWACVYLTISHTTRYRLNIVNTQFPSLLVEDKHKGDRFTGAPAVAKRGSEKETEAAEYKLYCLTTWPFQDLRNESGKGFAGPRSEFNGPFGTFEIRESVRDGISLNFHCFMVAWVMSAILTQSEQVSYCPLI